VDNAIDDHLLSDNESMRIIPASLLLLIVKAARLPFTEGKTLVYRRDWNGHECTAGIRGISENNPGLEARVEIHRSPWPSNGSGIFRPGNMGIIFL